MACNKIERLTDNEVFHASVKHEFVDDGLRMRILHKFRLTGWNYGIILNNEGSKASIIRQQLRLEILSAYHNK